MSKLRTKIMSPAQRYIDEPAYATVSDAKRLAYAIERMNTAPQQYVFGANEAAPVQSAIIGRIPSRQRILEYSHHERVPLRWWEPDGKGGFRRKQD